MMSHPDATPTCTHCGEPWLDNRHTCHAGKIERYRTVLQWVETHAAGENAELVKRVVREALLQ